MAMIGGKWKGYEGDSTLGRVVTLCCIIHAPTGRDRGGRNQSACSDKTRTPPGWFLAQRLVNLGTQSGLDQESHPSSENGRSEGGNRGSHGHDASTGKFSHIR